MLRNITLSANAFNLKKYFLKTFRDVFDSTTYRYRVKKLDWVTFPNVANVMLLYFGKRTIAFQLQAIVNDLLSGINKKEW
jgi:hypothetical protein